MLFFWRFMTIVIAALGLTMTSAHVLEMPQKMAYSPEIYTAVNTSLYKYFAIIGGAYQIGGILLAAVTTAFLRHRNATTFRWSIAGFLLLLLSFVSWLLLVQPVNREIGTALASAPDTVAALWMRLRDRWEYGHAVGFVFHLLGFGALTFSLVHDAEHRTY